MMSCKYGLDIEISMVKAFENVFPDTHNIYTHIK